MPLPPAAGLKVSNSDRQQLRAISRHRSTPRGIVMRINIVLGAAEGLGEPGTGAEAGYLGANRAAVAEAI